LENAIVVPPFFFLFFHDDWIIGWLEGISILYIYIFIFIYLLYLIFFQDTFISHRIHVCYIW
jgi:hypothetical protein